MDACREPYQNYVTDCHTVRLTNAQVPWPLTMIANLRAAWMVLRRQANFDTTLSPSHALQESSDEA